MQKSEEVMRCDVVPLNKCAVRGGLASATHSVRVGVVPPFLRPIF